MAKCFYAFLVDNVLDVDYSFWLDFYGEKEITIDLSANLNAILGTEQSWEHLC